MRSGELFHLYHQRSLSKCKSCFFTELHSPGHSSMISRVGVACALAFLGKKSAGGTKYSGGACGRRLGRGWWRVMRTWQHVERGRMWAPLWPWAAGQLCSGWRGAHGSIWSTAALLEATVTAVVMSWSSFKCTLCNLTGFSIKKDWKGFQSHRFRNKCQILQIHGDSTPAWWPPDNSYKRKICSFCTKDRQTKKITGLWGCMLLLVA